MTWPGWDDFEPGARGTTAPKKKHKYGAQPTMVDGIRFASKKEAERWLVLQAEEKLGEIRNLRRQIRYGLAVVHWSGQIVFIGEYIPDFEYERKVDRLWIRIVEDVKGFRTQQYRWKKRHFEAQYGDKINEV